MGSPTQTAATEAVEATVAATTLWKWLVHEKKFERCLLALTYILKFLNIVWSFVLRQVGTV